MPFVIVTRFLYNRYGVKFFENMKLYAFLDKKPVIFDTEDVAEMFAFDELLLITLKDGNDYFCSHHISAYPELLKDYKLEEAIEIKMRGRDVYTGNTSLMEDLKQLRDS